ALVAVLFGGVTLVLTRASMSGILYQLLEERALSTAHSLSTHLQGPMSTGDWFSVKQKLYASRKTFPDVRYIIVRDRAGRVVASTFLQGVPPDLQEAYSSAVKAEPRAQVLASREGRILDVAWPILDGRAGTVQLGVLDRMVTRALSGLTHAVLLGLTLCMVVGGGLAVVLTHILTRPIHALGQAAQRVREGDFGARAEVFSADEIGHLASVFNQMSESLEKYGHEVQAKERARVALLDRIVQAQEEERKRISHELHDQFGQSLTAIILALQTSCPQSKTCQQPCRTIETKIRELVDEVHRMSWGLRPSILDDYGLDSALKRYVEEVATHSGLEIDYQYSCPPGLPRLPGRVEVTLFRVAQEALTNVVRHAQATRASVVVLRQHSHVTLLIEDNGKGFDPVAAQGGSHEPLGLIGMRERTALLGGTCTVESAPGSGTTIRVGIPAG
ncbi:MAG: HAMP domain-containing protein, partial [Planctomycetes bacterium]|nr:HAMP domain-containing protein [Planctomycetota bacterium]